MSVTNNKLISLKEPVLNKIFAFKEANTLRQTLVETRNLQRSLRELEQQLAKLIKEL
jgi:hypothetical protein